MIKFLKQKNNFYKGFTLIETLVALSIFTTSVLAMVLILASSLEDTNYSKNKIIASYLAQEGIEYVRNMRDTYVLYEGANPETPGWNAFVGKVSNCIGGASCYFKPESIDYDDTSQPIIDTEILPCVSNICPNLYHHASSGRYDYIMLNGVDSGFSRSITYKPDGLNSDENSLNSDEIKITSEVSWKKGSKTYNVIFAENLFNWTK